MFEGEVGGIEEDTLRGWIREAMIEVQKKE